MLRIVFIVCFLTASFAHADESTIGAGHISVDKKAFLAADTGGKAKMLCGGCHGEDGTGDRFYGREALWGTPMIRGLNKTYFLEQLARYQSGERIQESADPDKPGEMNALMTNSAMSQQIMEDLSAHYANLERLSLDEDVATELDSAGKEMFVAGEKVFSGTCIACHGPHGAGMSQSPMPHLAGQIAIYTEKRLHFYQTQTGSGGPAIMTGILQSAALSDDDIKHVAFYLENVVGKR